MSASIYPAYPPDLSPEQSTYLLSTVKDWTILNGLAVRPSTSFVAKEVDPSGSLAVTAPVTLFPSLFPRTCFEEARAIQKAYNELYALVAKDEHWLEEIVEELAEVDDFIANLWNVHKAVKAEGYVQSLSLGIFRSDYMVHKDPSKRDSKPRIKQVEFNTIASSFGGLAAKVSGLHKHLLSVSAFPPTTPSLVTSSSLPFNPSIDSISQGLATAHRMYGLSRHSSHLPLCILFIVQDPENNVFDQHALAATLSGKHDVLSFRLPFGAATTHTSIPHDQSSRPLIYKPPHSPNTPYEVTTLYFRAGYSPSEYTSSKSWDARLHLERSAAIKCPSILTHLAGSKKVQQILATPSSPHLERFLSSSQISAEYIDRIRATFAAIYPLDDSSAGRHAISIATDPEKSRGYVLKPQREGGGNNVYGTKIPIFIRSLGDDSKKYRGHILMELIEPPTLRNSIFRNGQVMSGEVIGELGVYGLCLWHHGKEHTGSNILENWEAGYLLRTKGRDSEEGGVAAGFGAVDSVCLVDDGDAIEGRFLPATSANAPEIIEAILRYQVLQPITDLSKTATQYAIHDLSLQASATRAESLRTGYVIEDSIKEPQTFPRRKSRRASWSILRSSKSPQSNLWNPVNSSAITSPPSTNLPADAENLPSLRVRVDPLRSYHGHSSPNLKHFQRNPSQSHSSLQVQVSQPPSTLASPKKPLDSPKQSLPLTPEERSITALPTPPTMSPHPSAHSDTPSKRPPTPAKDLEYGIPNPPLQHTRSRTPSRHSRRASSTKSDLPWNPTHPCYPHPNPHIPLASPLHSTTRIIRIPRDWMIAGDVAPTFSNTYPEILEPWVSEADFRMLIRNVNDGLIAAFSPYGWRAWMDALLGVATGWIWEDLGFAGVKQGVRGVEQIIDEWNGQRRNTLEKEEDGELVRAIPLRRTGYMSLDIQIPDPHVGAVEEEEGNGIGDGAANENGSAIAQEGETKS